MSKRKPIATYEFGTLYIEGQAHKEGETPLSESTFNNLWDFILSNAATKDVDVIMTLHTRGGRKYIRTGRYVGTIQTKDGQVIEILPKIYKSSGEQEKDKGTCRKVFLNMLRHFTDANARSFQNSSLNTKKGFPILEVYISNYINCVEELVLGGLKKNYTFVEENHTFLRGKLNITKQITQNITNKAKFAIKYNKYIENIPQNRVIVTTLRKLMNDSHSTTNQARLNSLLMLMSEIPSSTNIEDDLRIASSANRLFSSYDLLIKWSSQFLLNRGFTTFAGSCVNQSLLFQAEKIFEDFVAYLFKKYASSYNVDSQNTRYFLVDRHEGQGMFRLRPDILVEFNDNSSNYDCIIIDTKWKAIDSSKPDKHYLLDMKDMYQLYAYGQKYRQGQSREMAMEVIPKLVLVYPYSEKFTEPLPEFLYEEIRDTIGLRIMVVPFDLSDPSSYKKQVYNIIHCLDVKPHIQPVYRYQYNFEESSLPMVAEEVVSYSTNTRTMLVGCYKNQEQLDWILSNHLYNIRLGRRNGSIESSGTIVAASRLLLYNPENIADYKVYQLDSSKQIIATHKMMEEKKYPNLRPNRKYILYLLGEEIIHYPKYDVQQLRRDAGTEGNKNAPFYIYY